MCVFSMTKRRSGNITEQTYKVVSGGSADATRSVLTKRNAHLGHKMAPLRWLVSTGREANGSDRNYVGMHW